MMKACTIWICGLSLLFLSSTAAAFGKLGHHLVCQLAYDQLTPQNQQKLTNILASMSKQDKEAIAKFSNTEQLAKPVTFAQSCTWADAVRGQSAYDPFKTWHYINIDRNERKITRDSCKKDCITQGIAFHRKQAIKAQNQQNKLQAIMFLAHWIGDIHQPLHVSFASDWGGNKIKVTSHDEQCTNMHWLWDQCLLSRQASGTRKQTTYQQMYQKLTKLLATQDTTKYQHGDEIVWANESLAITLRPDTHYCEMNNGSCQIISDSPLTLTNNYQATFAPIINQRVLQAAQRLATELGNIL